MDDTTASYFDYSKAIITARLVLEEAEINHVQQPDDPVIRAHFNEAVQRYRATLADPLGLII